MEDMAVVATVRVERADDPAHWAMITLSPRVPDEDERAVGYSNTFSCSIKPLGPEAEGYHLEVWEGGILGGLMFVFRRSELSGVLVHRVEGQLSYADMEGLAYASTVAGIRVVGSSIPIPTNQHWVITEG
jgi:hypothetical protein